MPHDAPPLPVTSSTEPEWAVDAAPAIATRWQRCTRARWNAPSVAPSRFSSTPAPGEPVKIAVIHYAPIKETVIGEPEPVFPFLGSSRLERPLEHHQPALALHGHAHHGTFSAEARCGVRVCNVSLPVLRDRGQEHPFALFDF